MRLQLNITERSSQVADYLSIRQDLDISPFFRIFLLDHFGYGPQICTFMRFDFHRLPSINNLHKSNDDG